MVLCGETMNENELALKIARQVVTDTQFWIAVIGIVGGVIGAVLTLFGNFALHWFKEKPQKKLDSKRKALLNEMLDDKRFPEKWRKLSTLSSVIGADEEETKRLLIEIDARGSEKNDGKWGLIKNHPFREIDQ